MKNRFASILVFVVMTGLFLLNALPATAQTLWFRGQYRTEEEIDQLLHAGYPSAVSTYSMSTLEISPAQLRITAPRTVWFRGQYRTEEEVDRLMHEGYVSQVNTYSMATLQPTSQGVRSTGERLLWFRGQYRTENEVNILMHCDSYSTPQVKTYSMSTLAPTDNGKPAFCP